MYKSIYSHASNLKKSVACHSHRPRMLQRNWQDTISWGPLAFPASRKKEQVRKAHFCASKDIEKLECKTTRTFGRLEHICEKLIDLNLFSLEKRRLMRVLVSLLFHGSLYIQEMEAESSQCRLQKVSRQQT